MLLLSARFYYYNPKATLNQGALSLRLVSGDDGGTPLKGLGLVQVVPALPTGESVCGWTHVPAHQHTAEGCPDT